HNIAAKLSRAGELQPGGINMRTGATAACGKLRSSTLGSTQQSTFFARRWMRGSSPRMTNKAKLALAASFVGLVLLPPLPASAADPSWTEPVLLDAAKKEGSLVIYTSV